MIVFTARVSSRDPDRFDITRASGGEAGHPFAPSSSLLAAGKSGRLSFEAYDLAYTDEMRDSYRTNRDAWTALLARDRAVLTCYCVDPAACHRSLLAGILYKLGASRGGEVGLLDATLAIDAAIAATGHLTPRAMVTACDAAGAELCVVWTVLHRSGVIRESYESAKARGLLAEVRKLRADRSAAP